MQPNIKSLGFFEVVVDHQPTVQGKELKVALTNLMGHTMMYQMKFHPKNPYYVIANAPHQVWMVSKDAESPIVLKYESWTSNNDMKKELYTLYYKGERFKLPLGIPNLSFLKELLIREPRPEPQQQPQAIIAH